MRDTEWKVPPAHDPGHTTEGHEMTNAGIAGTRAVDLPDAPDWRGINHLALVTPDMDATVRFYAGVLGMRLAAGRPALTLALTPEERVVSRGFYLLSDKPTILAGVLEAVLGRWASTP